MDISVSRECLEKDDKNRKPDRYVSTFIVIIDHPVVDIININAESEKL